MDNSDNHAVNQVDAKLKLLVKGMRYYLEKWPVEQKIRLLYKICSLELNKAHLELQFIEDGI